MLTLLRLVFLLVVAFVLLSLYSTNETKGSGCSVGLRWATIFGGPIIVSLSYMLERVPDERLQGGVLIVVSLLLVVLWAYLKRRIEIRVPGARARKIR